MALKESDRLVTFNASASISRPQAPRTSAILLGTKGDDEQDDTYKEAEGFNLFWKSLP